MIRLHTQTSILFMLYWIAASLDTVDIRQKIETAQNQYSLNGDHIKELTIAAKLANIVYRYDDRPISVTAPHNSVADTCMCDECILTLPSQYRDEAFQAVPGIPIYANLNLPRLTSNAKIQDGSVVMVSAGTLYISFRGTRISSFQDMTCNFETEFGCWGNSYVKLNGRIHQGFHKRLNFIREDLNNQLQQIFSNSALAFSKIVISGHSLGGAMAILHLPDLLVLAEQNDRFSGDSRIHSISLYTFGSPGIGDARFKNHYMSNIHATMQRLGISIKIISVFDTLDPVPCLLGVSRSRYISPFKVGLMRESLSKLKSITMESLSLYHHIGYPLELFDLYSAQDTSCVKSHWGFKFHEMQNYVEYFRAKANPKGFREYHLEQLYLTASDVYGGPQWRQQLIYTGAALQIVCTTFKFTNSYFFGLMPANTPTLSDSTPIAYGTILYLCQSETAEVFSNSGSDFEWMNVSQIVNTEPVTPFAFSIRLIHKGMGSSEPGFVETGDTISLVSLHSSRWHIRDVLSPVLGDRPSDCIVMTVRLKS